MKSKTFFFLFLLTIITQPSLQQKIFFSTKHVSIHTTREVTNPDKIDTELGLFINQISEIAKHNPELKQKGETMIVHIESLQQDWRTETSLLLDIRMPRSLDFLGDFIHLVTGSPGPKQYDGQQQQIKDLYHVAKDESNQLKHWNVKIKKTNAQMHSFIDTAQKERDVLSNDILSALNITEASVHLDILHIKAQTLVNLANYENQQIKEIIEKGVHKLPSKHMFSPDEVKIFIRNSAEHDKLNSHLFSRR